MGVQPRATTPSKGGKISISSVKHEMKIILLKLLLEQQTA
jgi:hypothetical protein